MSFPISGDGEGLQAEDLGLDSRYPIGPSRTAMKDDAVLGQLEELSFNASGIPPGSATTDQDQRGQ
jgi:hypothetical protein